MTLYWFPEFQAITYCWQTFYVQNHFLYISSPELKINELFFFAYLLCSVSAYQSARANDLVKASSSMISSRRAKAVSLSFILFQYYPNSSLNSLLLSLPIQFSPVATVMSARCFFFWIISSIRSSNVFLVMKR